MRLNDVDLIGKVLPAPASVVDSEHVLVVAQNGESERCPSQHFELLCVGCDAVGRRLTGSAFRVTYLELQRWLTT